MALFEKGQPRPARGGRKKGSLNKSTLMGKEICLKLVSDPAYLKALHKRLVEGKLPPGVEVMLWDRGYGKVKDVVQHEGSHFAPLEIVLTDAATPPSDAESGLSES